jgi:hypothetical protein
MNGGLRVENRLSSAEVEGVATTDDDPNAEVFLIRRIFAPPHSPDQLNLFRFDKTDVTAAFHTRDLYF